MKKNTQIHSMAKGDNAKAPIGRRNFLKKLWIWAGIAAGIEFSWVSLTFFRAGGKKKKGDTSERFTEIAKVSDIPQNSVVPYRAGRLYICRTRDGDLLALSLRCSHLGCSVNWDADEHVFVCPCHASRFSITGEVMNPPATHPLDYYPLKIENGTVFVDLNHPINRKSFRPEQLTKV